MGITHKWEGTTLIVSSDSGTSSCDLKGDKGETGVRGPQGKPGVGGDGTSVDLSDYALKSEVPTANSQLTNDSGFITSIPSEYVTETELNNKGYAQAADIPTKISQLTNDSGFITQHQELGDYALKSSIPTKVSQLTNDKGYLTSVPSEYVTAEELEDGGYVTRDYLVENKYITNTQLENKKYITKDNLAPYYTELEVDNLLTHVRKDIPKYTSQLVNDSGYVKASQLENGEATWNSIKDNILDTLETEITWDGNTEGLDTHPTYTNFYKVSDIVISAEEAVGLNYHDYCIDNGVTLDYLTIPPVGNGWLATMDNGKMWFTIGGIMCVYDETEGCPKGIYFNKGIWDDGTNKIHYISKFILEKEQIKAEYLPDNIGGGTVDMSKYFETVGGDTLTWDYDKEGRYNVSELAYFISNNIPTLEELKQGGTMLNKADISIAFTEDNIIDVENNGIGTGCYIITDSITQPSVIVVYEENATFTINIHGYNLSGLFEKKGVYFVDGNAIGLNYYIKALTINGYTGFTKEVIKDECLPPMGGTVKSIVFTTVTELYNWLGNNYNRVLKVIFYTGANGGSMTMPFHKIIKQADGDYFLEENVVSSPNTSNGIAWSYNDINIYKGNNDIIILLLNGGSIEFSTDGTMTLRKDERLELTDEFIEVMGATTTVLYFD